MLHALLGFVPAVSAMMFPVCHASNSVLRSVTKLPSCPVDPGFTVQHRRLELAHCPTVPSSRCQPCPICGVSTYVHTYVKFAPSVLVTWRQSFGFLLCCSVFRGLSWLGVVGVLPPAVWVPSVTGRSCSLVSQLLCSY